MLDSQEKVRGGTGGSVGVGVSLHLYITKDKKNKLQGTSGIKVLHESLLANLDLSHDHLFHSSVSKVDGHHLPLPLVHGEDAGKGVKVALQEAVATEAQDGFRRGEGGQRGGEA